MAVNLGPLHDYIKMMVDVSEEDETQRMFFIVAALLERAENKL